MFRTLPFCDVAVNLDKPPPGTALRRTSITRPSAVCAPTKLSIGVVPGAAQFGIMSSGAELAALGKDVQVVGVAWTPAKGRQKSRICW